MSTGVLEARDLDVFHGPLQALHGVSITVAEGETVADRKSVV